MGLPEHAPRENQIGIYVNEKPDIEKRHRRIAIAAEIKGSVRLKLKEQGLPGERVQRINNRQCGRGNDAEIHPGAGRRVQEGKSKKESGTLKQPHCEAASSPGEMVVGDDIAGCLTNRIQGQNMTIPAIHIHGSRLMQSFHHRKGIYQQACYNIDPAEFGL